MARYVQNGKAIDFANTTGIAIKYGDVVVLPTRIAVALADIPDGATGAIALEEAYEFPTAAQAVAFGAQVYWDAANKVVTTTATGNTAAGIAITAKPGTAAGTVVVKIG